MLDRARIRPGDHAAILVRDVARSKCPPAEMPNVRSAKPDVRKWALSTALALALVPAFVVGAPIATAAESIVLILDDGQRLEGRVTDLGGAELEVRRRLGSKRIAKSRVDRWSLVRPEGDAEPTSLLMLNEGQEIAGEVEFDPNRSQWLIELDLGGKAAYPQDNVLRVVRPSGMGTDGTYTPRPGHEKRMKRAIEDLRSQSPSRQKTGRRVLKSAGFFALRALEDAIPESDPGRRLTEVAMPARVCVSLPAEVLDANPAFVETILEGDVTVRLEALRSAFLEFGERLYGVFAVLLLDDRQPPELRAYCVDLLQRTNQIKRLVDVYQRASGPAQLAVAVALADGGVYAGLETVIEALELDDVEVRRYAIERLVEYTGRDFGFDPAGDEEGRLGAIERWRTWWLGQKPRATERLQALLAPTERDPSRERANQLWQEGISRWEDRDLPLAEEFLTRATEADPTAIGPFVALGIIAYQEKGDYDRAKDLFRRALRRAPTGSQLDIVRLAYYHLGRIAEISLEYEAAGNFYERAIEVDPTYSEAWLDLGRVRYCAAIVNPSESATTRAGRFERAQNALRRGLEATQEYHDGLELLTTSNLPVGSDLPFSTRTHNRTLRDLKKRLARVMGRFEHQLARVEFARGDQTRALEWATKAAKREEPTVDAILLQARLFELAGRDEEATRARDRARRLDPTDPRTGE